MLLGVDVGTGSVKALLLGEDGSVHGEGSAAYDVHAPRPGWAESYPEEWWRATSEAVETATGSRGSEVRAIGLSGQMHGIVLAGEDGTPLRPAVLWADARSGDQLAAYRRLDTGASRRLANPPAVGMAGPSLLWLRDHEPEIYGVARWALQPKDWLRMRLTGEVYSEPSDASATLLYDVQSDDWAEDVIETLGLRSELLAPLVSSVSVAGELTRSAAESLGLVAGIPVAAGTGDTAAAMLGSGLISPGETQLTVGTGGQIVVPKMSFEPDRHGCVHLYRSALDGSEGTGCWYAMAAIQNAGLALEWVRRVLGASWEEVYEEAFSVPPGSGGVSFLPYLSGERTPVLDPDARGAWIGLGLDHGRAHLLRAALEGVAFALREGIEALEAAGNPVRELRLAGGGTIGEPWRRMLADVLGRSLTLLPDEVSTVASARGAALLAGLAAGVYRLDDVKALSPKPGRTVSPGPESPKYETAYARYRGIHPKLEGRDRSISR